jgi:signal transduction histidine kinase
MTSLVENLLSLARAHGGAETITLAPIQFNCLFHIVEEAWNNAMNRAMLDFRVEMPDDHLVLLGDKHGIIRLLSILLENAAKYTPPGGSVTLSVGVEGGQASNIRSVLPRGTTGRVPPFRLGAGSRPREVDCRASRHRVACR